MSRTRGSLGAALTALAVASIGATGADSAKPPDAATGAAERAANTAIVEIATPALPARRGTGQRERWRRLRSRSAELLTVVAERNRLSIENEIPETGQFTVELDGESVVELRRRLARDPRVQRVEPNRAVDWRYVPNDFAFNRLDPNAPSGDYAQWNLRQSLGPPAWDLSKGVGAEVAVLDTGINASHPDLAPRMVSGGITDTDGHGTHVAGLACGATDNGYGIGSLGFNCNIYGATITTCDGAAAAVVNAANRGSDAINMSFGVGSCTSMNNELQYALGRGSVLVAAGDNAPNPNPNTNYPAQWVQPRGTGPQVGFNRGLVVTAAKYGGTRASFAQMDTGVSVAAYGAASNELSGGQQGILSTWIAGGGSCGTCLTTLNGDSRFAYLVGTSMATPQVSGLVALMRAANPSLSATNVARLIKLTASHCGAYGSGIGWGVINAYRAVAAAGERDIDSPRSRVRRARRGKLTIARSDDPSQRPCTEELAASGVKTVRIFVAPKGSKNYRLIGKTKKRTWKFKRKRKKFRFVPKLGKRYRFYSIAVDKDGNREAAPEEADAKLKVKRRRAR